MGLETELKLSLPETQIDTVLGLSFWAEHALKSATFHLTNTYFDTPDRALHHARIALRIRSREGAGTVQTLKTRGHSVNGLSTRGEWEWPLTTGELDIARLQALSLEALKGIPLDQLTPLFTTNFQRTCWQIDWPNTGSRVEAALDRGLIQAAGRQASICELELELLEGDEQALRAIAQALSHRLSLTPSDKSKAERGFDLLVEP